MAVAKAVAQRLVVAVGVVVVVAFLYLGVFFLWVRKVYQQALGALSYPEYSLWAKSDSTELRFLVEHKMFGIDDLGWVIKGDDVSDRRGGGIAPNDWREAPALTPSLIAHSSTRPPKSVLSVRFSA
ncbi:hypothetical protein QBC47DRAFT_356986 [Echria macrotheca]|uniref:Uncharacterized protein n=1 Tax=Echria macrotheca TaxID=438768 RepID=A0AAJ0BL38_9PEZI|nr:hypothetical protein QBC47DRAFT_356986 [Echria macrotheca]